MKRKFRTWQKATLGWPNFINRVEVHDVTMELFRNIATASSHFYSGVDISEFDFSGLPLDLFDGLRSKLGHLGRQSDGLASEFAGSEQWTSQRDGERKHTKNLD